MLLGIVQNGIWVFGSQVEKGRRGKREKAPPNDAGSRDHSNGVRGHNRELRRALSFIHISAAFRNVDLGHQPVRTDV